MKKDSVVGYKSLSKWYKNVAHLPWAVFLEKEAPLFQSSPANFYWLSLNTLLHMSNFIQ